MIAGGEIVVDGVPIDSARAFALVEEWMARRPRHMAAAGGGVWCRGGNLIVVVRAWEHASCRDCLRLRERGAPLSVSEPRVTRHFQPDARHRPPRVDLSWPDDEAPESEWKARREADDAAHRRDRAWLAEHPPMCGTRPGSSAELTDDVTLITCKRCLASIRRRAH